MSSDEYSDDDFDDDFDDPTPAVTPLLTPVADTRSRLNLVTDAALIIQRFLRSRRQIQAAKAELLRRRIAHRNDKVLLRKKDKWYERVENKNILCDLCESSNVELFCKESECYRGLCRICCQAHHSHNDRDAHRLVQIKVQDDTSLSELPSVCAQCSEENVHRLYCYSCDRATCESCSEDVHKSEVKQHHFIQPLSSGLPLTPTSTAMKLEYVAPPQPEVKVVPQPESKAAPAPTKDMPEEKPAQLEVMRVPDPVEPLTEDTQVVVTSTPLKALRSETKTVAPPTTATKRELLRARLAAMESQMKPVSADVQVDDDTPPPYIAQSTADEKEVCDDIDQTSGDTGSPEAVLTLTSSDQGSEQLSVNSKPRSPLKKKKFKKKKVKIAKNSTKASKKPSAKHPAATEDVAKPPPKAPVRALTPRLSVVSMNPSSPSRSSAKSGHEKKRSVGQLDAEVLALLNDDHGPGRRSGQGGDGDRRSEQLKFLLEHQRRKLKSQKMDQERNSNIIRTLSQQIEQLQQSLEHAQKDHKKSEKQWNHAQKALQHSLNDANKKSQQMEFKFKETKRISHEAKLNLQDELNSMREKVQDGLLREEKLHASHADQRGELVREYEKRLKAAETRENGLQALNDEYKQENARLRDQLRAKNEHLVAVQSQAGMLREESRELKNQLADHRALVTKHNQLKLQFEQMTLRFVGAIAFAGTSQRTKEGYKKLLRRVCTKAYAKELLTRYRLANVEKTMNPVIGKLLVSGIRHAPSSKVEQYRFEKSVFDNKMAEQSNQAPVLLRPHVVEGSNEKLATVTEKVHLMTRLGLDLLPFSQFWKRKAHEFKRNNAKLRNENVSLKTADWREHNTKTELETKLKTVTKDLKALRGQMVQVELAAGVDDDEEDESFDEVPRRGRARPASARLRSNSAATNSTKTGVIIRSTIGMTRALKAKQQELDRVSAQLLVAKAALKDTQQSVDMRAAVVESPGGEGPGKGGHYQARPVAVDLIEPSNALVLAESAREEATTRLFLFNDASGLENLPPQPPPTSQTNNVDAEVKILNRIYTGRAKIPSSMSKRPASARLARKHPSKGNGSVKSGVSRKARMLAKAKPKAKSPPSKRSNYNNNVTAYEEELFGYL